MEDLVYTRKEVARMLKIHENTLLNWENKGLIERPKRIGKRVYFTKEQVDNILK